MRGATTNLATMELEGLVAPSIRGRGSVSISERNVFQCMVDPQGAKSAAD